MFYKVYKDNEVVDVLDGIVYLKYQEKYDRMLLSNEKEAQAILSSDEKTIWQVEGLPAINNNKTYTTVRIQQTDEYEYKQWHLLHGKTPEEIVDNFVLLLVNKDLTLLVESLKRLFLQGVITEELVKNLPLSANEIEKIIE